MPYIKTCAAPLLLLIAALLWTAPGPVLATDDWDKNKWMEKYMAESEEIRRRTAEIRQAKQDLKAVEAEMMRCRKAIETQESQVAELEDEVEELEADGADADILATKRKDVERQQGALDKAKRKLNGAIRDFRKILKVFNDAPGSIVALEPPKAGGRGDRDVEDAVGTYDGLMRSWNSAFAEFEAVFDPDIIERDATSLTASQDALGKRIYRIGASVGWR